MKVQVKDIFDVSKVILIKNGVPEEHARQIAETIVYAHIREKHTHGLNRLPIYINKIQKNRMDANTPIQVMKDYNAIQLIDAGNGFGQVATYYAVKEATQKARKYGIGLVGVSKSNNFGAAGFFGELACKENMIAIIISNSAPAIAPSGGKRPLFGTSPICYAFPKKNGQNIILDMATSVAARGKIRNAAKNGESIPDNWAIDVNGNPTTDPNEAIKGSMLPIGGYKGAGLSLCFDILAGLLMNAGFAGSTKGLNDMSGISDYGHFVLMIDIEKFMDYDMYLEKIDYLIDTMKADNATYPGENSNNNALKNMVDVNIPDKQYDDICRLIKELNIDIDF